MIKKDVYKNNINFIESLFKYDFGSTKQSDLRKSTEKTWRRNFRKMIKSNSFLSTTYSNLVKGRYWNVEEDGKIIANEIPMLFYNFINTFGEVPKKILIDDKEVIDSFSFYKEKYSAFNWFKELNESEIEVLIFYLYVFYKFNGFKKRVSSYGFGISLTLFSDEDYVSYAKKMNNYAKPLWDVYFKPLINRLKVIRKKNIWIQFIMFNTLNELFRQTFLFRYLNTPDYYKKDDKNRALEQMKNVILRDYITGKIIIWSQSKPEPKDLESQFTNFTTSSGGDLISAEEISKK